MYSFPSLEPICCFMSSSNCCFLNSTQISQEAGQEVWYSHLFKNFPVCCDPHIKGFSVVKEAGVDVSYRIPLLFYDPKDVGSLMSGLSDFLKSNLYIWRFTVHVLLKPGLENFEHYFTSVGDECNCVVV